jgi:hypothetical protein
MESSHRVCTPTFSPSRTTSETLVTSKKRDFKLIRAEIERLDPMDA